MKEDGTEVAEKKVESRVESKRDTGGFAAIPLAYKIGFLIVIGLLIGSLYLKGLDEKKFWLWVGVAVIILYLISLSEQKLGELTPEEAVLLVKKELKKRDVYDLNELTNYRVINIAPKYINGRPKYYQIGILKSTIDGNTSWLVATVDMFLGFKGFSDSFVPITGQEVPPSRPIIPQFVKDQRQWFGEAIKKLWRL